MVDGVVVSREALKMALLRINKAAPPQSGERAFVFTEADMLRIRTSRIEVSLVVEGALGLVASVPAPMLVRLRNILPKPDPLLIQIVDNELYIDTFSVTCDLLNEVPPFHRPAGPLRKSAIPEQAVLPDPGGEAVPTTLDALSLPRNVPTRLLLRMRVERGEGALALAGLSGALEKSLLERNRHISQALKSLERYQVRHADLVRLIDECVMRD